MEQTIKNIERTIEKLNGVNKEKMKIIKKMVEYLDLATKELNKINGDTYYDRN